MWVRFVQEVEAEDEDAAVDAFNKGLIRQHFFIAERLQHADHGSATVFDRREYPNANVAEAD